MQAQPMRIALISEHASPLAAIGGADAGGQNIYVSNVARSLASAGHRVDVLTRRDAAALPPMVDVRPGVRVLHVPAGPPEFVPKEQLLDHMPAFTRAAHQLLQSSAPYDVLHANFFMSGLAGLHLKEALNVPLVMTFHALGLVRREHQGRSDGFPLARIDIEKRLAAQADRLIAECPQDRSDLIRLYGARPSQISMVPCGVDLTEFAFGSKSQARRKLGLAEDEFVVLHLGRMVPRKGIATIIEALARLPAGLRVRLLVVGGDSVRPDATQTPEIGRLQQLAHQHGVFDRVTFTGRRERAELQDFYCAADVFVTTPWYEPFGITPLEAMACGTPVIGSAVGGIQYSVLDGVTGYLVAPRDPAALAARLLHLQANPELGRALGRAGICRVRSMFTWEHVAGELIKVYQALRRRPAAERVLSSIRARHQVMQASPQQPHPRQQQPEPHQQRAGGASCGNAAVFDPPSSVLSGRAAKPSAALMPVSPMKSSRAAVFLDKDGTLVDNVPYNADPRLLTFTRHAIPALQLLARAGWALVIVSNQSGLSSGRFSRSEFAQYQRVLTERLRAEGGIELTGFYVCPHLPLANGPACLCRKPAPGMLRQAARAHGLDLARSWMVGDILDDIEAGRCAGCQTVLLDVGSESQWRLSPLRTPHHRSADLLDAARIILAQDAQAAGPRQASASASNLECQ